MQSKEQEVVVVATSKKASVKFNYDEDKLKAISMSLEEKHKNIDEELLKFFDSLYQKNVPKAVQKFIEKSNSQLDNESDNIKGNVND